MCKVLALVFNVIVPVKTRFKRRINFLVNTIFLLFFEDIAIFKACFHYRQQSRLCPRLLQFQREHMYLNFNCRMVE